MKKQSKQPCKDDKNCTHTKDMKALGDFIFKHFGKIDQNNFTYVMEILGLTAGGLIGAVTNVSKFNPEETSNFIKENVTVVGVSALGQAESMSNTKVIDNSSQTQENVNKILH